jgi:hypothetical protein
MRLLSGNQPGERSGQLEDRYSVGRRRRFWLLFGPIAPVVDAGRAGLT